ncbi:MAG TPA: peptidoglycan-binding domain-containing protein [Woeseiaceae bacterium]|nr:peptidoglycan-binding domain-containing protein [Woeseiaceae bacterium]
MKWIFVCLAACAGMFPLALAAETEAGKYAVRGAGLIDCQTFLDEQQKQSKAYLMIGGWIDGYITGVNQYANDTYDATSFESTELFAELIENHCRKNPEDRLFPVVNSIIQQRWGSRITEQTPRIGITLGEMHVGMYRETLNRIQARLAEKGFYELPATGEFDAKTITAIASFQKTLDGYKPTGFPDQATLWALFVE